jgi:hypothetical protein
MKQTIFLLQKIIDTFLPTKEIAELQLPNK